ncbi:MAG: tetratricopeptide repeat protein [Chthonomonadales bacterium]
MSRWAILALAGMAAAVAIAAMARKVHLAKTPGTYAAASGSASIPISEAHRRRVLEFWSVYQQASDARQARRWSEAAAGYRKALALQPDHWDSLYYLGTVLMELKRYTEAEEAFRHLAVSEHTAARGHSALAELYSNPNAGALFDLRRAAAEYELARRNNADESGSVLRLGEVALALGDLPRAADYLSAAARTNFKSVGAFFLRGYIAWQSGDRAGAEALYRHALELTRVQKPPKGVLGEGDTKLAGHVAMVLPGQHGLFDQFVAQLWKNRDASEAAMEGAYTRLKIFIASLPKKHAGSKGGLHR